MPEKTVVYEPIMEQTSVEKRDGSFEPADYNKILRAVSLQAENIEGVDPAQVAHQAYRSLVHRATTREIEQWTIEAAAALATTHPGYNRLALNLKTEALRKEVAGQGIYSFSQSIKAAHLKGLVGDRLLHFVERHVRKLNQAIRPDNAFSSAPLSFGLTFAQVNLMADRYLLRDRETRLVIETPQYFLMRLACQEESLPIDEVLMRYARLSGAPRSQDWGTPEPPTEQSEFRMDTTVVASRPLLNGMGQAVAERTILRKDKDGAWETWHDVANRVAYGNALLATTPQHPREQEYRALRTHLSKATTLMSGRHLQHGDASQPTRPMEVFTNCSTSSASFLLFYLLLNGSGVGRCYDDDMMLVNWDLAPNVRCVLDQAHPDFIDNAHDSVRDARHMYGAPANFVPFIVPERRTAEQWRTTEGARAWRSATDQWEARVTGQGDSIWQARPQGNNVLWYQVPDSREGWAKALELWENYAFEKDNADKLLILDFSAVRPKGMPIGGMQDRPSSGPLPLMNSFAKASALKGAGLEPWLQAMFVDHYFAECVLVGGARRAARMSTKTWRDKSILAYIRVKRPIEYDDLSLAQVIEVRKRKSPFAFLWSSNNSVTVDEDFWEQLASPVHSELRQQAAMVFDAVCEASYGDGTGEPGFINVHKLVQNDEGWGDLNRGDFVESPKYRINEETQILFSRLAKRAKKKRYHMITNPCGEIALNILGGFCVIADGVPFHADTIDEAEDALRSTTRSLIRVNLMDSIYRKEVRRTNRIGVGLTGVHEFAWKFFGYGFRDLIDEEKSKDFWLTIARFHRAVWDEAQRYSKELGLPVPHTVTTVKPSGTVSKLFGLTEGWHLPSMAYYLRWVQFRSDDPLVQENLAKGYPIRELKQYEGTTIVGFPTAPAIASLGMGDKLVLAGDATPEEQYRWLMLGEKYWINGTDEHGAPLPHSHGNQISYTLKYKPDLVDFDHFRSMVGRYQSQIRCCSVMPQEEASSYEYLPEQPISEQEYWRLMGSILAGGKEDIGREHVDCASGACPVDFKPTIEA